MLGPCMTRSKKHLENAATLRAAMEQEEAELSPDEAPVAEEEEEEAGWAERAGTAAQPHAASGAEQASEADGADEEDKGAAHAHGRGNGENAACPSTGMRVRDASEQNGAAGQPCSSSDEEEGQGSREVDDESSSEASLDEDGMMMQLMVAEERGQGARRIGAGPRRRLPTSRGCCARCAGRALRRATGCSSTLLPVGMRS